MTAAVSEDWEDLVETLRSDLETVSSGEPEDEEVRSAIDEVWAIVDAAEDRVGSVDVEEVGDVLGVDADEEADGIDVESISREFVSDDPQRAARLSRLVALINVDEATSYDVGRLWRSEEEVSGGSSGSDESDSSGEDDSASPSAEDAASDPSMDDPGEALRSQLGDTLSEFRDRIQDAREGLESGGDADESEERGVGDSDNEASRSSTSTKGRSTSSNRSSTTFSTVPSARRDMDGLTHLSTMPGRQGRSRTATRSLSGDDQDDRPGSDGEE